MPDWIGDFQNPELPQLFAEYAERVCQTFQVGAVLHTLNEIFVCAKFSGQLGWWNEQLATDRAFVTSLKHMAQANLLAEEQYFEVQPRALFIQSETSQYFHAGSPGASKGRLHNQKRFLSLDLCYGE